jgi:peptide deformylase
MNSTLKILRYPHPVLRQEAATIKRVDAELRSVVRQMFGLMYEAKGVGLAATQVGLPLRLFVANLEAEPQAGEELVFLNPVITHAKGSEEAEEGCLSLPGIYGRVSRPKQVRVSAYTLAGEEFQQDITGLFARVVQHEFDHLNGVLFIDRLSDDERSYLAPELSALQSEFDEACASGVIAGPETINDRLADWKRRYC